MKKGLFIVAATLLLLLALTPTTQGFRFCRGRAQIVHSCNVYQPVYQQPYYQQPYYQAPTPYYTPPPYYQKIVAQEIAVAPLVVTVPVDSYAVPVHAYGSPYYYSVGQAYQEKAYLRDILREELRNLIGQIPQQNMPISKASPLPPPPVVNKANDLVFVPDDTTPLELQKKVLDAYSGRANCISCHGATGGAQGPKGRPFRLVTEDSKGALYLTKFSGDKRWKIYSMSSTGIMPPAAINDASKAMEGPHLLTLLEYAKIGE